MFGNIYGLDLGTYEIKVFDKKQDKICRERDVIAIKNKKNIFAIEVFYADDRRRLFWGFCVHERKDSFLRQQAEPSQPLVFLLCSSHYTIVSPFRLSVFP